MPRSMKSMVAIPRLMRLVEGSSGATTVEYALMVSAIAGIIAAVVYVLGAKTNNLYNCASYWLFDDALAVVLGAFVGG
jgi:Flp pilus assembly pilin Flp